MTSPSQPRAFVLLAAAGYAVALGGCVDLPPPLAVADTTASGDGAPAETTVGADTAAPACGACSFGCVDGACRRVVDLAAGGRHACAALEDGDVVCWGNASYGQVGSGVVGPLAEPPARVALPAAAGAAVEVAVGYHASCARTDAGDVWCWGANHAGQVGGSAEVVPTPVRAPVDDAVALVAGKRATFCAIRGDRSLWCWGAPLAAGTWRGPEGGVDGLAPTRIAADVDAVGVGAAHACYRAAGRLSCWGDNGAGQLGDGSRDPAAAPVPVDMTAFEGADAGPFGLGPDHTCAATADGARLLCWGSNANVLIAQAASTPLSTVPVPTLEAPVPAATEIGAGALASCVRHVGGQVSCWGSQDTGLLGPDAPWALTLRARRVADLPEVHTLAMGWDHACALDAARARVVCWGSDRWGALGDGSYGPLARLEAAAVTLDDDPRDACVLGDGNGTLPVGAAGPEVCTLCGADARLAPCPFGCVDDRCAPILDLRTGAAHACALDEVGQLWCWGHRGDGAVGDGTIANDSVAPLAVLLPRPVDMVALGTDATCALDDQGAVACWGRNGRGQTGQAASIHAEPRAVALPGAAVALHGGSQTFCAALLGGELWCWGLTLDGQAWDGERGDPTPTRIDGVDGPDRLALGSASACARADGVLRCWGANGDGELCDGTWTPRSGPVDADAALDGAADLDLGAHHLCAITASGEVRCCGSNTWAQLGSEPLALSRSNTPAAALAVTGPVRGVAAGWRHSCAIDADGVVWCWGRNEDGELGVFDLPDGGDRGATPRRIGSLPPARAVRSQGRFSCALGEDGLVRCWGEASLGALDGDARSEPRPWAVWVRTKGIP